MFGKKKVTVTIEEAKATVEKEKTQRVNVFLEELKQLIAKHNVDIAIRNQLKGNEIINELVVTALD